MGELTPTVTHPAPGEGASNRRPRAHLCQQHWPWVARTSLWHSAYIGRSELTVQVPNPEPGDRLFEKGLQDNNFRAAFGRPV